MKTKNVLIVTNMFPSKKYPHYGIFVKHSAEILRSAGYKVTVEDIKKTDNRIVKLFTYIIFYIKSICRILFGRYDVIYAHYASHTALPILIAKKIRKKIPLVVNVHGNDVVADTPRDESFFGLVRKLLDISDKVICPSTYFKDSVMRSFSIESEKIIVYPSGGIDTEFFKRMSREQALKHLGLSENNKYIGYVSRIEQDKGWDIFLKAGKKIIDEKSEFKLIVVGDGSLMNEYNTLVSELNLLDNIIKFPLLSHEEVRYIFNSLDVFVFPTYRKSESLGLVGLESMACETITVLPDQYGPSSYAQDKENSVVFKSKNELSLLEAIKFAINNDCSDIRKGARKTALKYNHLKTDKILIQCFDELLGSNVRGEI